MWTRAQLKQKAKYCFKLNYWKVVLVSIIISLVGGGISFANGAGSGYKTNTKQTSQVIYEVDNNDDLDEYYESLDESGIDIDEAREMTEKVQAGAAVAAVIVFFFTFLIVFTVIMAVTILLDAFLLNHFEVGSKRFFFKNLSAPARTREVMFTFDHNYKNVTKVMFLRDLYTALWTLLFIIPGIVKGYEYKMIPYLLAENPDMSQQEAFGRSKQMMDGNKWKAFVLDLSFLGWSILSALTLGILGIFYVNPYYNMTQAAFYEAVKFEKYGYVGVANPNMGNANQTMGNPQMS